MEGEVYTGARGPFADDAWERQQMVVLDVHEVLVGADEELQRAFRESCIRGGVGAVLLRIEICTADAVETPPAEGLAVEQRPQVLHAGPVVVVFVEVFL